MTPHPKSPELALDSTTGEASLALLAARATAAVVMDGDRPVGVITMADLAGTTGDLPGPAVVVADLMTHECVQIDPSSDERQTLRRYSDAAWVSLFRRRPGDPQAQARRRRAHRLQCRGSGHTSRRQRL